MQVASAFSVSDQHFYGVRVLTEASPDTGPVGKIAGRCSNRPLLATRISKGPLALVTVALSDPAVYGLL